MPIRPHWISLLTFPTFLLTTILLALSLAGAWPFFFLVPIPYSIRYFRWRSQSFELTPAKLSFRAGILFKESSSLPIKLIANIQVNQGFFGTIFGYGDVLAMGAGSQGIVFRSICHPTQVGQAIEQAVESFSP